MNQIKIYDIAGSAGVSLATVSRVLNHPEKVKKATREKVMKIIKDKGYKPNANARGLASRKSTTVAVIVPTLTRASIAESIQGIDDSAKKFGYSIRLFVNNNKEEEKELWGDVIASSVDGILFMNDEMSNEVLELADASPVPVVFVNANANNKNYCSVSIDNEECAYNITKQMIERGNKRIVFITTTHYFSINELKVKGYKKAMEEAGLTPEVIDSTGRLDQNEVQYKEYLEHNRPDVVLAVRDSMAISFMNTATKLGIKVPEELQVIGFQNTRYSSLSNPQLTCVETPIYEIGNIAMEKLTQEMQSTEEIKPEPKIVDYKIVWRGSTK
jgi:LacI family transcriptional regulator